MRAARLLLAAAIALGAAGARAQHTTPADPAQALRQACQILPHAAVTPHDVAVRAECVLAGFIPANDRFALARDLARQALKKGEPAGGLILYRAFHEDPANEFEHEGHVDKQAYERLAARTIAQRQDQIEAIEGLATATNGKIPAAAVLLASYFHDTVAPRNVTRMGALVDLLLKNGQKSPLLDQMSKEAKAIEQVAPQTQASAHAFFDAYPSAAQAALAGYGVQTEGKTCSQRPMLKSVSAGDIVGAEYLPLKGEMVKDSYLVKGSWPEYWTFVACGEEVPVIVHFEADGWGGVLSSAVHNKG